MLSGMEVVIFNVSAPPPYKTGQLVQAPHAKKLHLHTRPAPSAASPIPTSFPLHRLQYAAQSRRYLPEAVPIRKATWDVAGFITAASEVAMLLLPSCAHSTRYYGDGIIRRSFDDHRSTSR